MNENTTSAWLRGEAHWRTDFETALKMLCGKAPNPLGRHLGDFQGIPVISTNAVVNASLGGYVQVRFPRSKKRRIQKKWAKRTPRNIRRYFEWVPDETVYLINGAMHVSPEVATRIRALSQRVADDLVREMWSL